MLALLLLLVASALERGLVALQHGQLQEARAELEEAARLDPKNPYVFSSLAETYLRLRDTAKAASAAETAEKMAAGNPLVSHALAMYYSEAGQFVHAGRLEQTFAGSPKADPQAWERAAGLYLEGGDAASAVSAADKAVAAHPSPVSEDMLGRALIATGHVDQGLSHLAAAWAGAKANPQISFDYAQILLEKQDFTRAAEVVSAGLGTHPDNAQLTLALGVARYGQRRFDDAIVAFLKVVTIDPRIPQPYRFLGEMLDQAGSRLGEITQASEIWAAQNPKNARAQLLLAKVRLARDPADPTAESLLRRSIALDAGDWEAHYELGVLLASRRDYKGAAAELARCEALAPKQPMPHYHLARVYDRLGEPERAKAEREIHQRLTGSSPK